MNEKILENINGKMENVAAKWGSESPSFIAEVIWVTDSINGESESQVKDFLHECEHGTAYGQDGILAAAAAFVREEIALVAA